MIRLRDGKLLAVIGGNQELIGQITDAIILTGAGEPVEPSMAMPATATIIVDADLALARLERLFLVGSGDSEAAGLVHALSEREARMPFMEADGFIKGRRNKSDRKRNRGSRWA